MKRTKLKQKGMTILEGIVSGAVMVGVVVMSFEVMSTGVKVSKKATNDAVASEDGRSVLEQFVKDVAISEAIMAEKVLLSKKYESGKELLILKSPVFADNGSRKLDESRYIIYTTKDLGFKNSLTRLSIKEVKDSASVLESQRTLSKNVDKIHFVYYNTETIPYDPSTSSFVLPGKDDKSDDPGSGKISLRRIKPSWSTNAVEGRSALLSLLGFSIAISDTRMKISGMNPAESVEISYALRPEWTKTSTCTESKATQVMLRIETKENEYSPLSTTGNGDLTTTATCRNTK